MDNPAGILSSEKELKCSAEKSAITLQIKNLVKNCLKIHFLQNLALYHVPVACSISSMTRAYYNPEAVDITFLLNYNKYLSQKLSNDLKQLRKVSVRSV